MIGKLKIPRKPPGKLHQDRWGTRWVETNHIRPALSVPNFGVELEMGLHEADTDSGFVQKAINEIDARIGGYYNAHEDCGAWEIVSVPLNYDEIRLYLKTLLEGPIPGQTLRDPEAHGMHVHYGAKFMQNDHLERVVRFMLRQDNYQRNFLNFIAGRETGRNGWGYLPTLDQFQDHMYCGWRNSSDDWRKKQSQRNGIAINTDHDTHEFRLFATTNSASRACANVEFVQALADVFRPKDSVELQENTKGFIKFVVDNSDIYPHLGARLRRGIR